MKALLITDVPEQVHCLFGDNFRLPIGAKQRNPMGKLEPACAHLAHAAAFMRGLWASARFPYAQSRAAPVAP